MRRAQLVAEAVAVCCPYCGEPQPNREGSEMWIAEDFAHAPSVTTCTACDAKMQIAHDSKAKFPSAEKTR